jgi:hypothetical protein
MMPAADCRFFLLPRQSHLWSARTRTYFTEVPSMFPDVLENLPTLWRQVNNLSTTFLNNSLPGYFDGCSTIDQRV